jgi:hypothetical protein
MSFAAAVGWSMLRALVLAVFSVVIGRALQPQLRRSAAVVLWPLLVPSLVLGFAYRNLSLSLLHWPVLNELLYDVMHLVQLAPLAAIVLYSMPPPALSVGGLHCARTIWSSTERVSFPNRPSRWTAWLYGTGPHQMTAGAIVFLLVFQETDVAALMQVRGWPEWLFMQQSGGAFLTEAWPYVRWPALLAGLFVVAPLVWQSRVLFRSAGAGAGLSAGGREAGRTWSIVILSLWLTAATALLVGWPVWSIGHDASRGASVISSNPRFLREIFDALMIGLITGLAAVGIAGWLIEFSRGSLAGKVLLVLAMIPGLLGGMIWGLALKELVDLIAPALGGTPLPLVFGVTLLLLPKALLIVVMLREFGDDAAVHTVRLLDAHRSPSLRNVAAELRWQMHGLRWFWAIAIICFQGYLELSLTFLLRPPNIAPAPVRLYNFLHYGRVPGLAAMLVLSLAAPLALASGLLLGRRLVLHIRSSVGLETEPQRSRRVLGRRKSNH